MAMVEPRGIEPAPMVRLFVAKLSQMYSRACGSDAAAAGCGHTNFRY